PWEAQLKICASMGAKAQKRRCSNRRGIARDAMDAQTLLQEISDYCRRIGMAESTFGRLAVNDGKFVNRLKYGGRITTETLARVRTYIAQHAPHGSDSGKPFVLPRPTTPTPIHMAPRNGNHHGAPPSAHQ